MCTPPLKNLRQPLAVSRHFLFYLSELPIFFHAVGFSPYILYNSFCIPCINEMADDSSNVAGVAALVAILALVILIYGGYLLYRWRYPLPPPTRQTRKPLANQRDSSITFFVWLKQLIISPKSSDSITGSVENVYPTRNVDPSGEIPDTSRSTLEKYTKRTSTQNLAVGDIEDGVVASPASSSSIRVVSTSPVNSAKSPLTSVSSDKKENSPKSPAGSSDKKESSKSQFVHGNYPLDEITSSQVLKLIKALKLNKYEAQFKMNMFSGRVLCELTSAEDLVDCGINMSKEEANGFIAEIESLKVKGVPYRYIS